MALQDFLGNTIEIKIIDFLAQNSIFDYNQTEISKCLNISRTSVNQKLPELIFNGIVEIKERRGNSNYYQLSNNEINRKLVGSIMENSSWTARYENDVQEIQKIKADIGESNNLEECECFIDEQKNTNKIPKYASTEGKNIISIQSISA
ncbi:winged helix-turn-helix domain-containing protein [Methanolapillus millepedarum]|uniref:Winged helix-turn-helix transcriptional regulator n=1 Tax=Methanolapillus millepedarum TaxID=3028296 RepID=A0AA97A3Y1_9EURY|nr:hypothetical protein MsAc7_09530 [Methanosarcinaceae archaeon Ac7]